MNKIILILLFVIFSTLKSQSNLYWFKKDIENTFVNDSTKDKSWRSQMGATYFSINGYHQNALESWDLNFGQEKKISRSDSLEILKFKPINAKKEILKRAKKEQIVILNEMHHNASHRNFARSLLKGLYAKGYKYLGVETLQNDSINFRKFAVQKSGFYSREPQFGLFLKEAVAIGFKIFEYEAPGSGRNREIGEAKNIYDFLKKHRDGNMLIYCGYAHAYEGIYTSWEKAMAERLKDLSGIDPFTIDQTQYSEKSQDRFTEPALRIVNKKFPTILVDRNHNIYKGTKKEYYTDAVIIGSKTEYKNGKPTWMLTKGRKFFLIPTLELNKPVLVLAYKQGEYKADGVPEDITEIKNLNENNYLVLGKGNYDLIYLDEDYKILKNLPIKVK